MKAVLPSLVFDLERRTAMQLAWLRKFPFCESPCCDEPMCFKCKTAGHHEGMTCAERQRMEDGIEAQFCPSCGVATVKSEGCDHIVCVCGREWTWDGDDD